VVDEVRVWDADTGEQVSAYRGDCRQVWGLAFSPDGTLAAAAATATARDGGKGWLAVWDARSGKVLREWQLPTQTRTVLFAPDGRHVLTGDEAGGIYVLRLKNP
jgi:U4/U6 small nuclear ribonucleoprotein PRP4